jgi:hypothetical protein
MESIDEKNRRTKISRYCPFNIIPWTSFIAPLRTQPQAGAPSLAENTGNRTPSILQFSKNRTKDFELLWDRTQRILLQENAPALTGGGGGGGHERTATAQH